MCRDETLKEINPPQYCTETQLHRLVDRLITRPNIVEKVCLARFGMSDEVGEKVAQYVAKSRTLVSLDLAYNQHTFATVSALAGALCVNTSLYVLFFF